jgi:hypothetical protein
MALAPQVVQCIPVRFEPGPDNYFAAGLQDTGGSAQAL